MTARASMANLILELRQRCEAGTAEYQLGSQTYWSDDHLQAVLDRQREDLKRVSLVMSPDYSGGSALYYDYYWPRGDYVEDVDGGTAWRIEDSTGSAIGTADYTVNVAARHIRFGSDQQGQARYLTYRVYDLDRAEADVWDKKAANVASRFDVKTDNHDLKRSQLEAHYRTKAADARRRAPARSRTRVRDDLC